jgi:hypothetical protein
MKIMIVLNIKRMVVTLAYYIFHPKQIINNHD